MNSCAGRQSEPIHYVLHARRFAAAQAFESLLK
jgi:hypothetical protein